MRRSLVLTNESARNAFRASLPAHVFEVEEAIEPCHEPEVLAAMASTTPAATVPQGDLADEALEWWRLTRSDVRGFVSTYLAVFMAVLVFII